MLFLRQCSGSREAAAVFEKIAMLCFLNNCVSLCTGM